jgi:hypothetical protein
VSAVDGGDHIALAALIVSGLALAVSVTAVIYSRRQAIAAEKSIPKPPPPVDWKIEPSGASYLLRNVGTETATGVRADLPKNFPGRIRLTGGDTVRPQSSLGLEVTVIWARASRVAEIPIVWDGQDEPVHIPMPVRQRR